MRVDKFGQMIFNDDDIIDLYLKGVDVESIGHDMITDGSVDLTAAAHILENVPEFLTLDQLSQQDITVQEFDQRNQACWHMPAKYQELDIAAHVLNLCNNDAELQRCGQELMLFQEHGLFALLKYLTYLVDVMRENRLIWGVGRGSSVSSYVLYKLGVHRIDSLYYDLDIHEFLR